MEKFKEQLDVIFTNGFDESIPGNVEDKVNDRYLYSRD